MLALEEDVKSSQVFRLCASLECGWRKVLCEQGRLAAAEVYSELYFLA
jgi:hypothetical protein